MDEEEVEEEEEKEEEEEEATARNYAKLLSARFTILRKVVLKGPTNRRTDGHSSL